MTDQLPEIWGCLKTDLFATRHRAKCLNSCFGAQTDRKLYSCPAEEYISSMFFLILLYPNNNMEYKTRKRQKIISIYQAGPQLSADLSYLSGDAYWQLPAAADMVCSGPGMLMVPPHHLCWLGLCLQQIQPSSLEVQHVMEKHPWHHEFR